jgi:hypothetical protein
MLPILASALNTKTTQRFRDAKAFGDAVEDALRHLDSVSATTSATDELAKLLAQGEVGYREVDRVVVALEQALSSWPGNEEARQALVRAHLFFAEVALRGGDLGVVEAQLDRLQDIPEGTVPIPEEQTAHAADIRKRLARAREDSERRRLLNIGLQVAAAVMLLALIVGGAASYFVVSSARDRVTTERNHLSQLMIQTAADGIEAELHGLFDPVRSNLQIAKRWGRQGALDTNDPEALKNLFLPMMRSFPGVSLVTRADQEGHEWVLIREGDGWQARMTSPGEVSRWWRYDAGGNEVETYTKSVDYDPHTRALHLLHE